MQMDDARGVAAYYDRLAAVYGAGAVFGARRAAVLTAITPELAGAHRILDLGCGNGTYTAEFVARAPTASVVGVDLAPDMLHEALRRLGERVALVRADATRLPFRTSGFSLVFMSHVLQLVDEIERCVAEVAACLAPGGLWVSTIGVGGWRETVAQVLGLEALQELATLVGAARSRAPTDNRARVAAACAGAGLEVAWRDAPFTVTWPAVEEWLRIRWMTIVDETARLRTERWLDEMRPRNARLTFQVAEALLVARRI